MRAAVITAPGQAPRVVDRPDPVRPDRHSLVVVTAAPITPLDVLCASGTSYFGEPAMPYVPGVQGVGVVRESGSISAGTRVWFPTTAGMQPGDGSHAQLCSAPDSELVVLPDGVDDAAVAALGLSAVAGWMALTSRAGLRTGERVLVLGAGGAVGQVAVQAARLLGAGRVVGACRSPAAQQRAWGAGADAVVVLGDDDGVEQLAARFTDACGGMVDVVIDPLCGTPASAATRVLAPRGRLVNLGSSAGPAASFDSATLRSRTAAVLGYTNNDLTAEERRAALGQVVAHATAGRLHVHHETVPLDDVGSAWSRQADASSTGRIVLTPGSA